SLLPDESFFGKVIFAIHTTTPLGGTMRSPRVVTVLFLTLMAVVFASTYSAQEKPIAIRAGMLLDGKGGEQRNANIEVQGWKMVRVDPNGTNAATPTYDLRMLTLMPGMIDSHVHISWHFGKDGRYEVHARSPVEESLYTVENLYVTLMAGFTTVQSVGA